MRKLWKLMVVFVVAALVVPLVGCGGGAPPEGPQPYKIGLLASLSGYIGSLGLVERQAWVLAVEDFNKQGGINGHLLEAVVYDEQSDAAMSALLARKMITEDKVLAICMGEPAECAMAAKSVTEDVGVPLLLSSGLTSFTLQPRAWTFSYVPDETEQVGDVIQLMGSMGNLTRLGYLGDSTTFGKDAADVLKATASDFGITVVDYEQFNPGDVDMVPQLTRIKLASPQIIWIQGFDMASVLACEQAKTLKMNVPIFVMVPTLAPDFIKAKPEALEGVYSLSTKGMVYQILNATDPLRINNERLATEIMAKYGRELQLRDPHMYDGVLLAAEGIRIAGLTNEDLANIEEARTKVRDALETVNITGCFDSYDFGANGKTHRTVYPIRDRTIITVKNGQRTFLQWVTGDWWPRMMDLYLKKIGQT